MCATYQCLAGAFLKEGLLDVIAWYCGGDLKYTHTEGNDIEHLVLYGIEHII